jgi:endonuclease/exonuclease/phosphatase family metal-dependent hydrolase
MGAGPTLPYLLRGASTPAAERLELLHGTRAYAYHIARWLHEHRYRYHLVGLQEVYHSLRPRRRRRQRDYYRVLAGYESATCHRVGFAGFRYENVILSQLPRAPVQRIQSFLPGRIVYCAACGFTLEPYLLEGRTVWIGNTHLHPRNPRTRARQAEAIARTIRKLGDAPVLFMGDLNTVPPGCKDGDFADGHRDVRSYRDDRTLGILGAAGLRTVTHRDSVEHWTYPTGAPNRTLDYILFTRHWRIESYQVVRDFTLSDHYPVEGHFRLA